ncbi:hypothetical protein Ctob_007293, partial [Chrysochromulina tobinii]
AKAEAEAKVAKARGKLTGDFRASILSQVFSEAEIAREEEAASVAEVARRDEAALRELINATVSSALSQALSLDAAAKEAVGLDAKASVGLDAMERPAPDCEEETVLRNATTPRSLAHPPAALAHPPAALLEYEVEKEDPVLLQLPAADSPAADCCTLAECNTVRTVDEHVRRARWEGARDGALKVEGVPDGALEVDDAVEPRRRLEDSLEDGLVGASVATARIVTDAKPVPEAKDTAEDGPEAAEPEAAEVTEGAEREAEVIEGAEREAEVAEGAEDEEQDPQLWARVQDLPDAAHGTTKNHQALLRARQHYLSSHPQASSVASCLASATAVEASAPAPAAVVTAHCSEPVERGDLGEIYSAEIDCSEPVELDLRGARKRIAKCEELIARIKASDLPALVLEELNHLEMVLREAAPTTAPTHSLLVPGVPL